MQFEAFGKYVLLEKLATGGMAEVFLARGNGAGGIGKFFAIKRILPQYADSPEFIDMFKDEAKIAINLSHSNIVSIHEFGVEKGQFFLVMDYMEGRNLRQILNKMKKTSLQFSIDQIVFMIKEVASGLDHAHRCIDGTTGKPLNITHRDMSPQNIMVSFEGEVKIVDFGIAKAESQIETTRAGTLKGKFGYMSPEQAEGQPVDLRTDIFSLGIVMWELLAHDRLFVANNEINTLRKIRDCQIPSLRKINPNIHGELERIVQKSLARDRNLRYQTGAALQRDLNRFLNRQYPDFSAQDFSVFARSVFADEILALRKRLVDYAKINLTPGPITPRPMPADDADSTSVLATGSNSLVSTDGTENSNPYRNQHDADAQTTDATAVTNSQSDLDIELNNADSKENAINPGGSSSPDPLTAATDITVTEESTNVLTTRSSGTGRKRSREKHSLPQPERAANAGSNSKKSANAVTVLSDDFLNSEHNRNLENSSERRPVEPSGLGGNLETEEITSSSIVNRRPSSANSHRAKPERQSSSEDNSTRMATMMVFVVICMCAYAYLVKYFAEPMGGVIAITDPYLAPIHDALGVPRRDTGRVPTGKSTEHPANPAESPNGTPTPAPTPDPGPVPMPNAFSSESPNIGLPVTSNPSGAEIFINNQSTGLTTPNRIEIPANGSVTITLRKRGYYDYKKTDLKSAATGTRLDVNLQKTNVGYLDVEIIPPQEATLYVNGREIEIHRNMAREIPVPGNSPTRVRVESRNGLTYDEETVVVGVDRRHTIRLNPRKMQRQPSSSLQK